MRHIPYPTFTCTQSVAQDPVQMPKPVLNWKECCPLVMWKWIADRLLSLFKLKLTTHTIPPLFLLHSNQATNMAATIKFNLSLNVSTILYSLLDLHRVGYFFLPPHLFPNFHLLNIYPLPTLVAQQFMQTDLFFQAMSRSLMPFDRFGGMVSIEIQNLTFGDWGMPSYILILRSCYECSNFT